jgi:hypothetical protein
MTVDELIVLLRRCEPDARVTWDHDGCEVNPTALERCRDGSVELLSTTPEMLETLIEIGRDIVKA